MHALKISFRWDGRRKEGICMFQWGRRTAQIRKLVDTDYCYAACHILSITMSLLWIKQLEKQPQRSKNFKNNVVCNWEYVTLLFLYNKIHTGHTVPANDNFLYLYILPCKSLCNWICHGVKGSWTMWLEFVEMKKKYLKYEWIFDIMKKGR